MTAKVDEEQAERVLGQGRHRRRRRDERGLVVIGDKLGLWRALAHAAKPLSPAELAQRTETTERYIREWLNAMAAGGYVTYCTDTQTYRSPPEQAVALADPDSPAFVPGLFQVAAAMWAGEIEDRGELPHRRRPRMGPPASVPVRRHRAVLPLRLPRQLDPGVAAGARRRRRQARARRARCGRRLRRRRVDDHHGEGVSEVAVLRVRLPRRLDRARAPACARRPGSRDRVTFEVARATDFPGTTTI